MSIGILQTAGEREWTVLPGSTVLFPLRGLWTARIEVDADEEDPLPYGPAELILAADNDGEPVVLSGFIAPEDIVTFEGRATAMLVAGGGKLAREPLPSKTYQQAPLPVAISTLVIDAVREASETLDEVTLLLTQFVDRWHRVGGRTAKQLLDRLAERVGLGWRMGDDGAVVVAVDSWPTADEEAAGLFLVGPADAINRTIDITVERASLRPGTIVQGHRIEEAVYTIEDGGLRALLRFGSGTGAGGLREDVEQVAREAVPPLVYRELHACTVRRQNLLDGTLDLDAGDENPAIGGITAVPYRPGIVGCKLKIAEGERVLLGFDGGDEAKPYATAWDPILDGVGVARKNDTVNCGVAQFLASSQAGTLVITYTPPDGSPPTQGTIQIPGIGDAEFEINIRGIIDSASEEVFIRGVDIDLGPS